MEGALAEFWAGMAGCCGSRLGAPLVEMLTSHADPMRQEPGCYLLVLLADVVQTQGRQVVLASYKEAATFLIQEQRVVAAGMFQLLGAQPVASL